MSTETKIYIADLAAYNNGFLHGVWIDATDELDDIQDQINAMLKASPVEDAEEYAVHDYEGFDGYSVGEYDSIDTLHEIAGFIEEQPEFAGALLAHFCGDLDEARKAAEDNYNGCYKSVADYAQDLTEQTSEVPKHLEFYIDYERMGGDMEMSGDIFTIETAHDEVHVFWNH
ncbi:MAG: antirestriction protein ArdA [Candidatus Thiodiazotropha sp. (ex Lucina aurantia)]|nr:antirestriction protein ArdA [Candidatus Thiodiazotropha taylori]MBV2097823.1 antirestriction protein ArdA [Candidatus Thiodiazotropha sp. (ex Codakia orbicularis)]MBV2103304.1 antirestriction protein ArdA [Candidatus Thiodiazotropha sp. (ex Lucina aurantia)]MBV2116333.1 antirestriction protein ArdA [Candidatus Thiodiazotropha sp. (ex Lucina aurantia)]